MIVPLDKLPTRQDATLALLRHELKRMDTAFEAFRSERLDRDRRTNGRWYQVFLSLSFSLLTAAASVVWFAANADTRIERNFASIRSLQANDARILDLATRLARTEAMANVADTRAEKIERTIAEMGAAQ